MLWHSTYKYTCGVSTPVVSTVHPLSTELIRTRLQTNRGLGEGGTPVTDVWGRTCRVSLGERIRWTKYKRNMNK